MSKTAPVIFGEKPEEQPEELGQRHPLSISPVPADMTPLATMKRLNEALSKLTKSASRLENVAHRAGLREETGKNVSVGAPKTDTKFFTQLAMVVRLIEAQAERIEDSTGQIHELF